MRDAGCGPDDPAHAFAFPGGVKMFKGFMVFVATTFAAASAAGAADIDFSKLKCKDFIAGPKEEIGTILVWLEGYYTKENAPPILYTGKMEKDAEKLGAYCAANGGGNGMSVMIHHATEAISSTIRRVIRRPIITGCCSGSHPVLLTTCGLVLRRGNPACQRSALAVKLATKLARPVAVTTAYGRNPI